MKLPKPVPKFKVGERVIVSIPRGDFDFKFDGKVGTVYSVNELAPEPEYTIEFDNSSKTELHFLEQDLEPYSNDAIIGRAIGLKCPECGKGIMEVIPHNDEKRNIKVKIIIFECLFSATFDLGDNLNEMQKRLDEAKTSGKLKEFGILK